LVSFRCLTAGVTKGILTEDTPPTRRTHISVGWFSVLANVIYICRASRRLMCGIVSFKSPREKVGYHELR
jgi:hypothetical protein